MGRHRPLCYASDSRATCPTVVAAAQRSDGKLHRRGAFDMRSGVAGVMAARVKEADLSSHLLVARVALPSTARSSESLSVGLSASIDRETCGTAD